MCFFTGFTDISSSSSPFEIVTMLNQLYTVLDHISSLFDVYKVLCYFIVLCLQRCSLQL